MNITNKEQNVLKKICSAPDIDRWEHLKDLDDPESHFKKIKAKIALKANKKYQEDVIREEKEKNKVEEMPIEVKDGLGRVMEKKYPKMKSKRIPNSNRPPKKRPPLKKKKSFAADQKLYDDIDKGYNPMVHLEGPSLIDKITIERMIKL